MPGWAVVGILLLSQVHLGRTDSFPCWRSCSVRKHSISSFHVHLRVIHTHILDFCSVWGSSCAPITGPHLWPASVADSRV